jgi:hypothetical protein
VNYFPEKIDRARQTPPTRDKLARSLWVCCMLL